MRYNYQIATNQSSTIPRGTNKSASYNEIFRFTQELAQTVVSGTDEQARDKFEVLKIIKDMWESGIQVYVKPLNTNIDMQNVEDDENEGCEEANEDNEVVNFNDDNNDIDDINETDDTSKTSSNINNLNNPTSSSENNDDLTSQNDNQILGTSSKSNDLNTAPSSSSSIVIIKQKQNPIEDNMVMCKQVKSRGRPTLEQTKKKENLLKEFLSMVISDKSKINAIIGNRKLKKVINEEDVIINSLDRHLIIIRDQLNDENINYMQYFDKDASLQLNSMLLTIQSIKPICPNCREVVTVDNSNSMGCDKCKVWYHLKCLNLKSASKNWNCTTCSKI